MLCLTGDVHHSSLKINEQKYIKDPGDSEVKIACRYVKLIEAAGLTYTLYVTGKTLKEEWETFRPITDSPAVEIGGHTYAGLPRNFLKRVQSCFTGYPTISHSFSHGSYTKQKRDITKTIDIIREKTGRKITAWRSHGLVRDNNTYRILQKAGIRYISDSTDWASLYPETTKEGLISHAINVIMDHDHIYHAHRTKEYVERQKRNWTYTCDPTKESYTIEEWAEILKKQVAEREAAGGLVTVLMHPICMYTSDEFETAKKLFEFFSQFTTIRASDIERQNDNLS